MTKTARWLPVVGTIILALGLYLSSAGLKRYYPGVLLVVGCLCWIAFFALYEPSGNRPEPRQDDESPPADPDAG